MRWRAQDLADALGARLVGPDTDIDGATFDSRQVSPHQLFVPIVAQRDGHDFISDALKAGASAYLSSRLDVVERIGGSAIVVPDTATALIDAARWGRQQFAESTVVVGVTGSVGKTTTKDLIAAALAPSKRVVANIRSFNNEQGLPVTILNAPITTEVLVLEMGMRGHGQIADLCRIARPAIGVITRVGQAHTELLGGLAGVAEAKGELIEALPPQGMAILNADDSLVMAMSARSSAPVMTYGESASADVHISAVTIDQQGCAAFVIRTPSGSCAMKLSIAGRHMAHNAAAAIAVGESLGVSLDSMALALSMATISEHRMQAKRTPRGALLFDDCYNANPTSMAAALETLAQIPAVRKVAVLGVMAEITDPQAAYAAIVDQAQKSRIEILAVETTAYGVPARSLEEVQQRVQELDSEAVVLVKGSRVARLERVVDAVMAD